jgi:putative transposase
VRYAAIAAQVGVYAVVFMCRVLGVAPSGYYAWSAGKPSKKTTRDHVLTTHIRAAFKASRRRYGSPRVHAELRAGGHVVARKRVARLMRQDGLRARPRRRYMHTTQSKHEQPIAPNVVARKFEVTAPNQVWVSDLTYLPTLTGFVTLAQRGPAILRHYPRQEPDAVVPPVRVRAGGDPSRKVKGRPYRDPGNEGAMSCTQCR